ncbi:hypothetical protein [Aeromicrobium chenweiae]|uniref:Uncharacterized protein n=1 Tax=Aeromicrobium chenweiae TaxID=2079793 RepID=A0A2S0WJX7_9ACTN|nr:hypothetical protein [Aeromicrobium chenweiae]AWB91645.1 hypothetical protein C3E78_05120 [Aeromicrobium chenweiae]TGN32485.1 hypothetical protein E4L97_07080 [Aeromicrobium chenweiae]
MLAVTRENIALTVVAVTVSVALAGFSGHGPAHSAFAALCGVLVWVAVLLLAATVSERAAGSLPEPVAMVARIIAAVLWPFLVVGSILSAQEGDYSVLPLPIVWFGVYAGVVIYQARRPAL